VSSYTGEGFEEFIAAVESSREEYEKFDSVQNPFLSNMDKSFLPGITFQN
jgi:hypothetical protein